MNPASHVRTRLVVALLAGLLALLGGCSSGTSGGSDSSGGSDTSDTAAPQQKVAWPDGLPAADSVTCPEAGIEVGTAQELQAALDAAEPGAVIELADGTYEGQFTVSTSGTGAAPIWLCGGSGAVLRGPGTEHGVVLHLQQVSNWRLVGFTVREGQKGVMADGVTGSVFQGLTVTEIGDEAVHLRTASSGNVVRGLTISDTGLRTEKYGEGIYVGSAVSNWCEISDCEPDRSDHNVIIANTIGGTAAENVDIKEGTTGGVLAGNTFDGAGMQGDADSWVDVKGNGWLIQDNRGRTAARSGFQVNVAAEGWGSGNTFDGNTADVDGGGGYGYELGPAAGGDDPDGTATGNRVTCTNTATGAAEGVTDTACT